MNNQKLTSAIKLALLSAGAAAMSMPTSVLAQDSADEGELETVVVTGSRIPRADIDSASPVTVISADDIKLTGLTDVGDLLQRLPSMSGSPIGTTTNNGGNGAVLIDLRGLGTVRTLTLINGKRTVDGGDYQTIPAAMIERVEILKDGASAVYGADAVAGVVNIITRKDFDGIEIEAQTADFFDMDDGEQYSVALIGGKSFSGGNFVFGVEYVDQDQAFQSDADWDYFQNSYFIYPAGCESQVTAPYDLSNPNSGCYVTGSSRIEEGRFNTDSQGTFIGGGNTLNADDGRTYNYAPVNYIQTPYERTNVFGELNFDLTDNIRMSAEVRGNLRRSAQELAPVPYDTNTDPGFAGFDMDGNAYTGISPDNHYLVNAFTSAGLTPEAVVRARRRMSEQDRRFEQEITQFQATLSLEGEINNGSFADGWIWNVFANKGDRSRTDTDIGQYFGPNLALALGPSQALDSDEDGQSDCLDAPGGNVIPGCVPLNLFGGPGTVTQAMLDYVSVDLTDTYKTKQNQFGGSIAGEAFELPGGSFGWAFGYEYRWEDFTYNPDSGKVQDEVTGNTGAGTAGGFHVNSFFFEGLAPLYDNGTQALDAKIGVRYDDFSTFSSETTFQGGVEFQATDSLKLRATYGEVFRAPNISELFQGLSDSFPQYVDPCDPSRNQGELAPGCNGNTTDQQDNQVRARVGGSPNLEAETGDTYTAGLVWTPEFNAFDMTVTVDYWKTEIDDVISTLGVTSILDRCYEQQEQFACDLITRRASDFSISSIVDTTRNLAERTAEGVDFEIQGGFDTDFGRFDGSLIWSHLLERSEIDEPGLEQDDLEGRYENDEAYPEDKLNYTIGWSRNDFRVSLLGEYISSLTADVTFGPCCLDNYQQDVDNEWYHDLVASYNYAKTNTNITLGITNISDEEPPYIDAGFNANTDPSTYRLFGRGYYVRLNQKF